MAETGRSFIDENFRGARFVRADLSGAVMRGVEVDGLDVDSPWLLEGGSTLLVNGIDVVAFVDAELDRRFPGRELRRAKTPEELRRAWQAIETAWGTAVDRVAVMPAGTVEVSVDGEWSFAQTVRHLIMATDTWLGRAVRGEEQPYHPLGIPNAEYETDGHDMSIFTDVAPTWKEVRQARAGRVAQVRDFLDGVTAEDLEGERANPWAPEHPETVGDCLRVIINEEWEHLHYATRDLDAIEARSAVGSSEVSAG